LTFVPALHPGEVFAHAIRFPRTVNDTIKDLLLEAAYPPENPRERRTEAPH
jgi:hypothetical protein